METTKIPPVAIITVRDDDYKIWAEKYEDRGTEIYAEFTKKGQKWSKTINKSDVVSIEKPIIDEKAE